MQRGARSANRLVSIVLSAVVTVVVLGYLLTQVRLEDLGVMLRDVDRAGLAAFVGLSLLGSVARAWRYRLLLAASGHAARPLPLFLVVLVRNFCADLLPARLGSVVYPFLVTTRLGVPLEGAVASFALAFVFDLLAMAPLLAVAASALGGGAGWLAMALAVGLFVGAALTLRLLPEAAAVPARWIAARRGDDEHRASALLLRLAGELEAVRRGGVVVRVLLLSLLVRLAKYGSLVVFLFALTLPRGYGPADLPLERALFGVLAAEAAASLPISGIAGFGAYEGTWAVVFERLGLPADLARATSLAHHLFTQVYGYVLGLLALAVLLAAVRPKTGERAEEPALEPAALFAAKLAVLLSASVAMTWLALGLPASADPRGADADEGAAGAEATAAVAAKLGGRILFDSNRGHGFGIYSMAPDGSDVRVVVDGSWDEVYPDASPDGEWVVFARQEAPGRGGRSSVWICRRDGSALRKLAADATFPSFVENGRRVLFERNRRRVFTVAREGGDERELFRPEALGFGGREVVKPRLAPDGGAVAFTSDRGGRWNAWGIDLKAGVPFHIDDGCEPSFFPGGREIVWVKRGGTRDRSGLYRYDRSGEVRSELQDAAAPRGHEYFPSVTPDGSFLLYAAARPGEHAHESANYQIFAKDLRGGAIARLTRDSFTNRWPRWLAGASASRSGKG